jgi:GNAT superfamily N-acetyltransferase
MIRQATLSDIPAMHRVRLAVTENRLAPTTRITEADYAAALTTEGRGWVAEVAGEIVGFAVGTAHDGNIWALFMQPGHERQGHGRQLHDTLVAWLWSQGLTRLWLTTEPGTRAETFYRKGGWRDNGCTARGEILFEMTLSGKA